VQGWGREVTTTGYGDLQGGSNEDLWYTDVFSGTSSASPIVVGAVGCMQGALRAANKPLLTPATARNILRTTGSPQQDEPGRPATQRIGNRPNLRQALTQLGVVVKGKEIHKEVIKEKDFIKDKAEKLEIKEIKEHKDKDKEKLEIKEFKDKEIKELVKEIRDKIRDKITDKIREVGPQAGGPSSSDLESRLGALEQAVGELTHFIASELRPDLQSSALSGEQDLVAISQQLQQQANDAKSMKDQKDIEKLRET
jgi:hypothetical protein